MKSQGISVENFSFSYGDEWVLKDVNFSVRPGQCILVAGRSGSGKSTLAKCLAGLTRSGKAEGTITVAGEEVHPVGAGRPSHLVGYVPQDPDSHIVTLSVLDEVSFGPENLQVPPGEIRKRVKRSLTMVGGEDLLNRNVSGLSGGQKQKVAIASVLSLQPETLILDEPTSSLDHESIAELKESIGRLKKRGVTTFILEHNTTPFWEICDRFLAVHEGRVCADLPPRTALERRPLLKDLGVRFPDSLSMHPPANPRKEEPLLVVRGLSKSYGEEQILDSVDLDIRPGEVVALSGRNGSGKTTLLRCIMNLEDDFQGEIFLQGQSTRGKKTSFLGRSMGLVFQNPSNQIFETRVEDELLFGPENFNMLMETDEVDEVLGRYGLTDLTKRTTFTLSHGEKRRLNVASVEACSPRLFLMDEVFIGQDLSNLEIIASRIRQMAGKGSAFLMVLHDPEVMKKLCSRGIHIASGQVAVDAPMSEFFLRSSTVRTGILGEESSTLSQGVKA